MLKFNKDLNSCPLDTPILVVLNCGSVHSAKLTESECRSWDLYAKSYKEVKLREFVPTGVAATYDGDAYFDGEVVGWSLPIEYVFV